MMMMMFTESITIRTISLDNNIGIPVYVRNECPLSLFDIQHPMKNERYEWTSHVSISISLFPSYVRARTCTANWYMYTVQLMRTLLYVQTYDNYVKYSQTGKRFKKLTDVRSSISQLDLTSRARDFICMSSLPPPLWCVRCAADQNDSFISSKAYTKLSAFQARTLSPALII